MSGQSAGKRGPIPKPGTRSNLVEVGLRMVHADGYVATGIQSIVEGAGVPKGSFYNHFASKDAFAEEIIDAYSTLAQERLRAFLCNAAMAPRARLEAYFDDRITSLRAGNYARGCLLGNFSAEVADHSAPIRENLARQFGTWSSIFEQCIAEAQQQGTINDRCSPVVLAHFIFNSWEGALIRMRVDKSDVPLREFKEVVFGTLLAAP